MAQTEQLNTFHIEGRAFKYEVRFDPQGKWKPLRLRGHFVVPGDAIFETYEQARAMARKRNRRMAQ